MIDDLNKKHLIVNEKQQAIIVEYDRKASRFRVIKKWLLYNGHEGRFQQLIIILQQKIEYLEKKIKDSEKLTVTLQQTIKDLESKNPSGKKLLKCIIYLFKEYAIKKTKPKTRSKSTR